MNNSNNSKADGDLDMDDVLVALTMRAQGQRLTPAQDQMLDRALLQDLSLVDVLADARQASQSDSTARANPLGQFLDRFRVAVAALALGGTLAAGSVAGAVVGTTLIVSDAKDPRLSAYSSISETKTSGRGLALVQKQVSRPTGL